MAINQSGLMEPGQRDRRVTIQQRPAADASETSGFPVDGPWTTLVSCDMAKFDVGGRERFQSAQTSAAYDTRWEMEYRADMDPELVDVAKLRRLVYAGRTYDIVAASQIGRRDGVEITTLAKVG